MVKLVLIVQKLLNLELGNWLLDPVLTFMSLSLQMCRDRVVPYLSLCLKSNLWPLYCFLKVPQFCLLGCSPWWWQGSPFSRKLQPSLISSFLLRIFPLWAAMWAFMLRVVESCYGLQCEPSCYEWLNSYYGLQCEPSCYEWLNPIILWAVMWAFMLRVAESYYGLQSELSNKIFSDKSHLNFSWLIFTFLITLIFKHLIFWNYAQLMLTWHYA